jgi:uncharacterized membrane protein YhaH (DUF805 family)
VEHWGWFLFATEGRINRKPFWVFNLVTAVLGLVINLSILSQPKEFRDLVEFFYLMVFLWPSIAVQVKRWHDIDKSGWWALINIIPIIGPFIAILIIGFEKGTPGDNRFGPDPMGEQNTVS